jgi:hypothetical protein
MGATAMKLPALVVVVLLVVLGLWLLIRSRRPSGIAPSTPGRADVYPGLRSQALHGSRASFGLSEPASPSSPWGALMEIGMDNGTATLVALSDGNASLYLSTGGGYIGGIGHESVRTAAQRMVTVAAEFQGSMKAVKNSPPPKSGRVAFYALTDKGVLSAEALEEDLGNGRSPLSKLFFAGQDVITQYRLIDERK